MRDLGRRLQLLAGPEGLARHLLIEVLGHEARAGVGVELLDKRVLGGDARALADGVVLAGLLGGEGKSIFLKALISLFGGEQVFGCPASRYCDAGWCVWAVALARSTS